MWRFAIILNNSEQQIITRRFFKQELSFDTSLCTNDAPGPVACGWPLTRFASSANIDDARRVLWWRRLPSRIKSDALE